MRRRTRRLNCPSRREGLRGTALAARQQRGYALLILMMLVTVLLVSLTAALPSVYREGQREREEELIFRGNEYARAIGLFRRRFNRFPSSVDELLHTNGIRFLRRAYSDPMSRDGKWRFIHATINGTLLDSRTQAAPGLGGVAPGQSPFGGGLQGQSPVGGLQGQNSQFGPQSQTGPTSSFFGAGQQVQGGFIAGVASSSSKESIRVLNHRTHYDEWEFLGLEGNAAGAAAGLAPVQQQPLGGQQGQPGMNTQPAQPIPQAPQSPQMPPLADQPLTGPEQ